MREIPFLRRTANLLALSVGLPALFLLTGCSSTDYQWGWYEVLPVTPGGTSNLKFLVGGVGLTLSLSIAALAGSIIIGLLVALPGLSSRPWLRLLNRTYVELFRAIPVLVMILWVYYGLPIVAGVSLGPFAAGILALTLCDRPSEQRYSGAASSLSTAGSWRLPTQSASPTSRKCVW